MRKKLNILMVEDSSEDAEVIQYALKKAGFNFVALIVNKRMDFIRSLRDFNPDIILSDFSMPNFDGLSALKIARVKTPHVPFVFVSGTIGEERAIEAVKNGATDYILKDNMTAMAPKIRRALREAKERLEKINAKKALEKSARQLAEAQEVALIGCWEYDLSTEVLQWSDQIYKILGLLPGTVAPSFELLFSYFLEDEHQKIASIREEAYRSFKDFSYYTKIKRNPDEKHRWIFVKAKFKVNKQGKGEKLFGTIQDVTDLKETEIKLEETNNELKTFIYKASHDLRGPISSALGLCYIAKEDHGDSKMNLDYLEMISDRIRQLDTAINSLIETMRIKDESLKVAKVNFDQIISEILQQFRYVEGASNVRFKVDVAEFEFLSYPSIISSILQNIIENAIKYSKPEFAEVLIKVRKVGRIIKIVVADNGVGIPEGLRERIFDMFFRGNVKSKGTGLGLYIVKNAVKRLNGNIKVDSIPGSGTSFSISLPDSPIDLS